jgi:hypothetical protein
MVDLLYREATMVDLLYREATFDRASVNAKSRTVRIAFSSEEPVPRGRYNEILSHRPGDYDFSRLKRGAPLLLNHSIDDQIGVVEDAAVENDGGRLVGRAAVRFGKSQLAREVFQDVQDGIRQGVSVGYVTTGEIPSRDSGDEDAIRFRWMPHELSFASVPADLSVGVGRSQTLNHQRKLMQTVDSEDQTRAIAFEKHILHSNPDLEPLLQPLTARVFGGLMKYQDYVKQAVELNEKHPPRKLMQEVEPGIGMDSREISQWSLVRALNGASKNGGNFKDSYEFDVSQQYARKAGKDPEGLWVPPDIVLGGSRRDYYARAEEQYHRGRRDLQVGIFGQGGAFVATIIETPMIDLLRNRTICTRMGAITLGGLSGNVSIPRGTAASTPQSLGEIALVTESNPVIDSVNLVPHRVSVQVIYSRQLLIQSSVDVEAWVRYDIMTQTGIVHDRLALSGGTNADEPTGIFNEPGISSITFGGAPTWLNVITFEETLGKLNADRGRLAYATTPGTRAVWKDTAKALVGATVVGVIPMWEPGPMPTDDLVLGTVNGYPAVATNQILNDAVAFVNWSDVLFGMWSGFDLVVDPYTKAGNAENVITLNTWFDVGLRHAASVCISSDPGSQ